VLAELGPETLGFDIDVVWESEMVADLYSVPDTSVPFTALDATPLGIAKLPVSVRNFRFVGTVRMLVADLIPEPPGYGAILLSLPAPPEISMEVIVAGADVTKVPFFRDELERAMQATIAEQLSWPRRMVVPTDRPGTINVPLLSQERLEELSRDDPLLRAERELAEQQPAVEAFQAVGSRKRWPRLERLEAQEVGVEAASFEINLGILPDLGRSFEEWTSSMVEWTDSLGRTEPHVEATSSNKPEPRRPSFSFPAISLPSSLPLFGGGENATDSVARSDIATSRAGSDAIGSNAVQPWWRPYLTANRSAPRWFGFNSRSAPEVAAGAAAEAGAEATAAEVMSDAALKQAFDAFDTDSSGSIDRTEMGAMVAKLGLPLSAQQVDELMAEADPDGNGEIDFEEFTSTLRKQLSEADDPAFYGSLAQVVGQASALLGWVSQGFELTPTGLIAAAREAARARRADASSPSLPSAAPETEQTASGNGTQTVGADAARRGATDVGGGISDEESGDHNIHGESPQGERGVTAGW